MREKLAHTDPPAFKTPIFDLFSPVAIGDNRGKKGGGEGKRNDLVSTVKIL